MNILVLGGTGAAGSRVAREAHDRGHRVTVASRRGAEAATDLVGISAIALDAGISAKLVTLVEAHDVVVLSVRAEPSRPAGVVEVTRRVAAAATGRRLLVVGGAGPLRVPDTNALTLDDLRYVPEAVRPAAIASVRQLGALREDRHSEWVYVAPAAHFAPGPRLGTYATGDGVLVVGADGRSHISMEDFAVALVDEIEIPGPPRRVLSVGRR